jgi:transposase-like protein
MSALSHADTSVPVSEVCRKMGISEASCYNWKDKYGGLGVPELQLGAIRTSPPTPYANKKAVSVPEYVSVSWCMARVHAM